MKTKQAINGTDFEQLKSKLTDNNKVAQKTLSEQPTADASLTNRTGVAKRLTKRSTKKVTKERSTKTSVSQTGINTTVENARKVNKALPTFVPEYVSAIPALEVPALEAIYLEAFRLEKEVKDMNSKNTTILNVRGKLYKGLNPYGTRIVGQVKAVGVDKKTLEDVQKILKKMRGVRIIPINPNSTAATISVAQTGFADKLAFYGELIEAVANIEAYAEVTGANSETAMRARYAEINDANDAADTSIADKNAAMRVRNAYFNTDITGVVDTYQRVKANVKAMYGATSAEFKAISGLVFAKIRE